MTAAIVAAAFALLVLLAIVLAFLCGVFAGRQAAQAKVSTQPHANATPLLLTTTAQRCIALAEQSDATVILANESQGWVRRGVGRC